MPKPREVSPKIQINVMRARLTVLGFNLAIITFQINSLRVLNSGVTLPGIDHALDVSAAAALFIGMALTFIAMTCFIVSSAFDQAGTCDHWILLAGDLIMYLALAQTITGFFTPSQNLVGQVSLTEPDQQQIVSFLHTSVGIAGGIAWALATYVGPLFSLLRSPFGRAISVVLGLSYVVTLVLVARVWTLAAQLESLRQGGEDVGPSWLGGLVAPLVW